MKSILLYSVASILLFACKTTSPEVIIPVNRETVSARLDFLSTKMENYLPKLEVDSMKIPRALDADGSLIAKNSRQWTSGFFPGTLWQLYGHSKSPKLHDAAKIWTAFIEKEKYDDHTHDLGFKLNSSFGKGYAIDGTEAYKDVVVQASKTLIQRYNPMIGAIRSWDWNADIWQFPVIIDNMMNLEMLFDATNFTGDSTYYKIAYQHAKTTLKNHFRDDISTYHVVVYDTITGAVDRKVTHQGYSDESAWSRGQAWGLYGFTTAYGRSKDKAFLDRAVQIADYFFNHPNMPEDMIPYWDFDAPNIPNEPRDVSAAAVAISGLMELIIYVPEHKEKYMKWIDTAIGALSLEAYQTNTPPFLLSQSTGSVPGDFEVNVPISYGDYYYIEALLRRIQLN